MSALSPGLLLPGLPPTKDDRVPYGGSGFPVTPILDNFDRDTGVGPNWVQPAWTNTFGFSITTGSRFLGGGNLTSAAWFQPFGIDQEAYVTVATLPTAGNIVTVTARAFNTGSALNGYRWRCVPSTGANQINRYRNGVGTTLLSITQVINAGDGIGIRCIGPTIEAWYRPGNAGWVKLGSVTDFAWIQPGYVGMDAQDTNASYDDFGGGSIAPDTTVFAPPPLQQFVNPLAPTLSTQLFPAVQPIVIPPAGIIFNDSGSGSIVLSGTSTESASAADSGSGSIVLSGTKSESASANDSRSGTIALSGTSTESASGSGSGSGTITLSGAKTESAVYTDSRVGTITLSGTSTRSSSASDSQTGTITLSGFGTENYQPPGATGIDNTLQVDPNQVQYILTGVK